MLTNLCFYNSKSFFSVVTLLSWVIFLLKTLIKAYITTLYWYLVAYMFMLNFILEQMALY